MSDTFSSVCILLMRHVSYACSLLFGHFGHFPNEPCSKILRDCLGDAGLQMHLALNKWHTARVGWVMFVSGFHELPTGFFFIQVLGSEAKYVVGVEVRIRPSLIKLICIAVIIVAVRHLVGFILALLMGFPHMSDDH